MEKIDKIINTSGIGSVRGKYILVPKNSLLKRFWGKNVSANIIYLHFIDSATVPNNGAVTHLISPIEVGAGYEFNVDFLGMNVVFINGMCIYASSTEFNKTLVATDALRATAIYLVVD